ncbi:hypothetical protein ACLKA7_005079 [Drosophila subpalustris]
MDNNAHRRSHLREGGRDGQEQYSGERQPAVLPLRDNLTEEDGIRAAPTPSGATAPESEDLPPAERNPELSQAASGSTVCPAGSSNSLKDSAENEDLAGLTLDPAAVEKMD